MAMGSARCCKEKILKALLLTINASDGDGNPSEKPLRVRAAALASLQKCVCCYKEKGKQKKKEDVKEPGSAPMPSPEGPPREGPGTAVEAATKASSDGTQPSAYYQRLNKNANVEKMVAEAEKVLKKYGMEEEPAAATPAVN